jgi:hypothetical protein
MLILYMAQEDKTNTHDHEYVIVLQKNKLG